MLLRRHHAGADLRILFGHDVWSDVRPGRGRLCRLHVSKISLGLSEPGLLDLTVSGGGSFRDLLTSPSQPVFLELLLNQSKLCELLGMSLSTLYVVLTSSCTLLDPFYSTSRSSTPLRLAF